MKNQMHILKTCWVLAGCLVWFCSRGQDPGIYSVFYEEEGMDHPRKSVVIALSGLKLRVLPDFDAKVIAIIPFGETVQRKHPEQIRHYATDLLFTPDSIVGKWEEIEWKGTKGFAFNAFLAQGILKMTDDFYLMVEDWGFCWLDTYASPDYHYYGIYFNADTSKCMMKTVKPTFYARNDDLEGAAVKGDNKQTAAFLLAAKSPLTEGPVHIHSIKRDIFRKFDVKDDPKNKIRFVPNTILLPESDWVVEGRIIQDAEMASGRVGEVWLRDKKSGRSQQLFGREMEIEWAQLIWCGDLDHDGLMDFMIRWSAWKLGGISLFLSRGAEKGFLVRPPVTYSGGDCC